MTPTPKEVDRIVTEPEREAITGYGRQHWWRLEQAGSVPKRIKLGPRRVGWLLSELLAWRDERVALRTSPVVVDPTRTSDGRYVRQTA